MIKTIIFDLGNVVLPFDVRRLAKRLAKHTHFSDTEIIDLLWNDYIADNFETGKMSPKQFFTHICEVCQFKNLTFAEFVPIFNEIFDEDTHISELIPRLKKNYKLGLISNTNQIHVEHILATYPVLGHFEKHWWSNFEGIRKPDPAIYHLALEYFAVRPTETIFIDDLHTNIQSAQKIGIHAIHYKGHKSLLTDLSKLGVVH